MIAAALPSPTPSNEPVPAVPAAGVPAPAVLVPTDRVHIAGAHTVSSVGPEAGVVGELVAHVLGELPALAVLADRERLLAAAWLASLRAARTRRSYAADLLGWRAWLAARGVGVLAAGRGRLGPWGGAPQAAGAGGAGG